MHLVTRLCRLALLLLVLSQPAFAQNTIFVRSDKITLGNGNNWLQAYRYLQTAIDAAQPGDQIWVKAGSHYPDGGTGQTNNDRFSTFTLKNGVAIYGGFDGVSTDFADRDPVANVTILSGDIDGSPADNTGNAYNVVTGSATDATAVLDGFTVSGGNADIITFPTNVGGGLTCFSGAPTVRNCIFDDNHSVNLGGGVYLTTTGGPSPTFTDCVFSNNTGRSGGGVFNRAAATSFVRCSFIGNETSFDGAGIYNQDTASVFTDCEFTSNVADRQAGGVFNEDSTPVFTGATFTTNTSSFNGGAMFNSQANPTLTDCDFNQNTSESGGGIFNTGSSPVLTDCTFTANIATADGGAVEGKTDFSTTPAKVSSPEYTRCTFTNNEAGKGGAIANSGSESEFASPVITDCIFIGNESGYTGGAIDHGYCETEISGSTFTMNLSANSGAAFAIFRGGASTVTGCEFIQNSAMSAGGGIYVNIGGLVVSDCDFTSNFSGNSGGGASVSPGSAANLVEFLDCRFTSNTATSGGGLDVLGDGSDAPRIIRCTFLGNHATSAGFSRGGGCAIGNASPFIAHCLFSGNAATSRGGAIYSSDGAAELFNCTISGSSCDDGGAIDQSGGSISLTNTIIYNNATFEGDTSSQDSTLVLLNSATASLSHSLLANFTKAELDAASGNTSNFEPLDPLFVAAVNPSLAPTTAGNLKLATGSPAIDVGDNSATMSPTDAVGNPRVFNGTIDLGALENQGPDPFEQDDDGDGSDGGVELAIGTDPDVSDRDDPRHLRAVAGAVPQFTFGYDDSTAGSITLELRRSTDLLDFSVVIASSDVGFPAPGGGGLISINDPSPPAGKAFYRLVATPK